jgi:hypothetical protein
MAAKRSEGVGPTGLGLMVQIKAGVPCAATPSVAFGGISPSWGRQPFVGCQKNFMVSR